MTEKVEHNKYMNKGLIGEDILRIRELKIKANVSQLLQISREFHDEALRREGLNNDN